MGINGEKTPKGDLEARFGGIDPRGDEDGRTSGESLPADSPVGRSPVFPVGLIEG